MNTNQKLNKLIKVALLSAIAAILMFIELPIFPVAPWLKLDFSEIPVLMGAFAFGPVIGVVIEGVKILLNLFLHGTLTAGVGELANFIVGIAFIVPASVIYKNVRSKKGAIIGMVVGGVSINIIGILANVFILLPFYHIVLEGKALVDYIVLGLIPLNTLKAVLVSVITYIIYKRVSISIFKVDHEFEDKNKNKEQKVN